MVLWTELLSTTEMALAFSVCRDAGNSGGMILGLRPIMIRSWKGEKPVDVLIVFTCEPHLFGPVRQELDVFVPV
jgi:hypothetical protein